MTVATDWLAAIGTVGTLAATVVLYDLDRRRQRVSDRQRQARQVSAWAKPVAGGATHREVLISNLSDEPVYDVNVFMAPRRYDVKQQNTFYSSLLPPHETPSRMVARTDPSKEAPKTVPRIELAFTDRNGVRWLRNQRGDLKELKDDDPESHRRPRS